MIFKKKYTHTEWFEGFLWAESSLEHRRTQENIFLEDTDGMEGYDILWRDYNHETPWFTRSCSREFGAGVLDYLWYLENKLK